MQLSKYIGISRLSRFLMNYAGKCAIFLAILIMVLRVVTTTLVPKYLSNNMYPTTTTFTRFYDMKKDSVDVLFLGSSHAVNGFNTQELYDRFGFRSYSLASEQQNLLTSFYWLEEALKYQSPKVVVLDAFMAFPHISEESLNAVEATTRKAFDYMKWGEVKRDAVKAICEYDESQSLLSYYLPNIRYHARWTGLENEDFEFAFDTSPELKGTGVLLGSCGNDRYGTFTTSESDSEMADMAPVMLEYLEKINSLCKEKKIELILTMTPAIDYNLKKNTAMRAFAAKHALAFYDYNDTGVYTAAGLNFGEDMADIEHANIRGSVKITDYIGQRIKETQLVETTADAQWEKSKDFYQNCLEDYDLHHETDFYRYLDMLDRDRYTVLISAFGEATEAIDDKVAAAFSKLGFACVLRGVPYASYIGVKNDGKVFEDVSAGLEAAVSYKGIMPDKATMFELLSKNGDYSEKLSSILIDGEEYSMMNNGLNIAVYDNDSKKFVDKVCFDTHNPDLPAIR